MSLNEKNREIHIKKLTSDMSDDFLNYFDHDAFSDHEEWSYCYYLESHLGKEENDQYTDIETRRNKARALIENGIMNGYLIYEGKKVIGWCNAGDKSDYNPICKNPDFFTDEPVKGKIKILYCIDIAPDWRGKGLARLVMERVLEDAQKEGFSYVEGYPFTDEKFSYQYRGPLKLYQAYGFEPVRKEEWVYIMRKNLDKEV